MLTSRLDGKNVIFRNLAWSADTLLGRSRASFDPPEKGFDRLKEQLEAIKPTVAFLGYGMAESFNGDVEKFKRDLNTLMDTITNISRSDVRFVLITPIFHENLGEPLPDPSTHNLQLENYANAIKEIADTRNAKWLDLYAWSRDYHKQNGARPLTDNGIHPTPFGYWRIAQFLERGLGLFPALARVGITADGQVRDGSTGIAPGIVTRSDTNVAFSARDAFLLSAISPRNFGETNRGPGMLMQFLGLKPGSYTLRIDDEPAAVYTDEQWKRAQQVV